MPNLQKTLTFGVAAALLGAGVYHLFLKGGDLAGPVPTPAKWTSIVDPEPHAPACAFWKPWQTLVAPGTPEGYLSKIKRRLAEPSTRSGDYQALIARSAGVLEGTTESVCIAGRFVADGSYRLEGSDADSCESLPATFLDSNLELKVERLAEGGFINSLGLVVGLQDIRPDALWPFFHDQAALMLEGYRGWSKAFPTYFEQSRAGFSLVGPEALPERDVRLRYAWQTQPMRSGMPKWTDYLMLLSDLVSVRTTFLGQGERPLLDSRVETVLTGMALTVPQASLAFLSAPTPIPLTVAHDVQVRFRGLEIELKGVKFAGILTPSPGQIVYEGKFLGAQEVVVGGSYRGVVGGSVGKMIHDLVREHLDGELKRLTSGNRGQGWTFRIGLETLEATYVLTYRTTFQSPINVLNILREDKDKTGNPVLPSARALAELNGWASASVEALLNDFAAVDCRL